MIAVRGQASCGWLRCRSEQPGRSAAVPAKSVSAVSRARCRPVIPSTSCRAPVRARALRYRLARGAARFAWLGCRVALPPGVPELQSRSARDVGTVSWARPRARETGTTLPGGGARLGALDLGTNNCRLLVATPQGDGFRVLDSFSRIVRLGEGLHNTGQLSPSAMD